MGKLSETLAKFHVCNVRREPGPICVVQHFEYTSNNHPASTGSDEVFGNPRWTRRWFRDGEKEIPVVTYWAYTYRILYL